MITRTPIGTPLRGLLPEASPALRPCWARKACKETLHPSVGEAAVLRIARCRQWQHTQQIQCDTSGGGLADWRTGRRTGRR